MAKVAKVVFGLVCGQLLLDRRQCDPRSKTLPRIGVVHVGQELQSVSHGQVMTRFDSGKAKTVPPLVIAPGNTE